MDITSWEGNALYSSRETEAVTWVTKIPEYHRNTEIPILNTCKILAGVRILNNTCISSSWSGDLIGVTAFTCSNVYKGNEELLVANYGNYLFLQQ